MQVSNLDIYFARIRLQTMRTCYYKYMDLDTLNLDLILNLSRNLMINIILTLSLKIDFNECQEGSREN